MREKDDDFINSYKQLAQTAGKEKISRLPIFTALPSNPPSDPQ